jgi:hypothetical protein
MVGPVRSFSYIDNSSCDKPRTGSFLEFLPIVDILTQSNTLKSGRSVSFDLVIPSLPGFTFSAPPPQTWTVNDTARVWNTLMVDVLGYESGYSVAGTDWVRNGVPRPPCIS